MTNPSIISSILGLTLYCSILAANSSGCSVSADNLDFGNYRPFSNSHNNARANIYIDCHHHFRSKPENITTWVTIILSRGHSNSYANRELISNNNSLSYNIYTNSQRTQIWGDGTQNTSTVTTSVKTSQKVVRMYGRIPKSQSIPPGVYTDNIIAEIYY